MGCGSAEIVQEDFGMSIIGVVPHRPVVEGRYKEVRIVVILRHHELGLTKTSLTNKKNYLEVIDSRRTIHHCQ